jgi:hypothetical protein
MRGAAIQQPKLAYGVQPPLRFSAGMKAFQTTQGSELRISGPLVPSLILRRFAGERRQHLQ